MWKGGLDGSQAGIKIAGRNVSNLRYQSNGRKWRGPKNLLMRVKKESEKHALKKKKKKNLNKKKTNIMAFSLTTSWQIEGKKVEGVTEFIRK